MQATPVPDSRPPQEEPDSNETLKTLQSYATHLSDLVDQVNSLRNQAHSLLSVSSFARTEAEQGFEQINSLRTAINEPITQDSFKKAYESFSKSPENVSISEVRRSSLKRTRPPSPEPESPRPTTSTHSDVIFPPISKPALTVSELPSYIREHNKSSFPTKIYIWTHARPDTSQHQQNKSPLLQNRIALRVSITDVLYAYVRCEVEGADDEDIRMIGDVTKGKLLVETVTVFGPRERKLPHSQSEFTVFQKISQHIAWMIRAQPEVELQNLINLLNAYESLFVSQCTVCQRILSEEGHIPPVCRIWSTSRKLKDNSNSNHTAANGSAAEELEGKWEPRHRTCLSIY